MGRQLLYPWLIGAYVYALKVDGTIRYIGKGRRYRMIEHRRIALELIRVRANGRKVKANLLYNKLAKALSRGAKLEHIVLAYDLNDADAFEREKLEIAAAPNGQLWNLKEGGAAGDPAFMTALWADPEHRKRFSEAIRNGKRKPEFREKARNTANEKWNDPDYRTRWMEQHRSVWDNPEKAAVRRALLKAVWDDPAKSKRKSDLVKSQWTPERKAAMSENRRRAWADPEFKARATASIRASKAKNDRSEAGLPLYPAESKALQT